MSELNELYQETILDHNKNPRNFREIESADKTADGKNPLCGDALRVYVKIDDDTVKDVSFKGSGCAISKASASMMTEAIKGKSKQDAEMLFSHKWSPANSYSTKTATILAQDICQGIGISGSRKMRVKLAYTEYRTSRLRMS